MHNYNFMLKLHQILTFFTLKKGGLKSKNELIKESTILQIYCTYYVHFFASSVFWLNQHENGNREQ